MLGTIFCTLITSLTRKGFGRSQKRTICRLRGDLEAAAYVHQISLPSKLCLIDQCILILSLRRRKETSFPIPISKTGKLRPDELVSPRNTYLTLLHCKTFPLPSFKATGEREEWGIRQATRVSPKRLWYKYETLQNERF